MNKKNCLPLTFACATIRQIVAENLTFWGIIPLVQVGESPGPNNVFCFLFMIKYTVFGGYHIERKGLNERKGSPIYVQSEHYSEQHTTYMDDFSLEERPKKVKVRWART